MWITKDLPKETDAVLMNARSMAKAAAGAAALEPGASGETAAAAAVEPQRAPGETAAAADALEPPLVEEKPRAEKEPSIAPEDALPTGPPVVPIFT